MICRSYDGSTCRLKLMSCEILPLFVFKLNSILRHSIASLMVLAQNKFVIDLSRIRIDESNIIVHQGFGGRIMSCRLIARRESGLPEYVRRALFMTICTISCYIISEGSLDPGDAVNNKKLDILR